MLLLTGARRGEVLSMKWNDIDLDRGIWVKPGSTTKQKTEHRVPLSKPALRLLAEIQIKGENSAHVFPGLAGHRVEIKKDWAEICRSAGITNARMHDLRHTFASVLASEGLSLPVIGALLGHSQVQTTARYSHLFDDPLRQATERAGAIVTGAPAAEVIPLKGRAS
jgi:integrase